MLGIYLRVSTEFQSQVGYSLGIQKEKGIQYAEKKNLEYEIFDEDSASAGGEDISLETRPKLYDLLQRITEKQITEVYITEITRISRNDLVSAKFYSECKKHGCVITTETGTYDLRNPSEALNLGMISLFSTFERENIRSRTKKGVFAAAAKGRFSGGLVPYGYTRNNERLLQIEKEEIQIYKRMVQLALERKSYVEIANYLNANKIPTRASKFGRQNGITFKKSGKILKPSDFLWRSSTVKQILKNTIYIGKRKFGGVIFDVPNLKVLSQEEYDNLHDVIEARIKSKMSHGKKKQSYTYMCKGILYCGECGERMVGRFKKRYTRKGTLVNRKSENVVRNHYFCRKKIKDFRKKNETICRSHPIRIDVLDKVVWESLVDVLEKSYQKREEIKWNILGTKNIDRDTEIKRIDGEISAFTKDVKLLERQKSVLLDSFTKTLIAEEDFKLKYDEYETEIKEKKRYIGTLRDRVLFLEKSDKWLDWLKVFEDEIATLAVLGTVSEKQNIVRQYIRQIVVCTDDREKKTHKIQICLHLPLIDDKLIYNNVVDKKKGYAVVEGKSEITLNNISRG